MTIYRENLFGETLEDEQWIIFHDESYCKEENFLYHGFLYIRKDHLQKILCDLLLVDIDCQRACNKKIHFTDLSGLNSSRSIIALKWLQYSREWLNNGLIKFYCFGVNLNNVNHSLWQQDVDKKIYVRFFDIGLHASLKWFKIPENSISDFYYDQGKHDLDRYYKAVMHCGVDTNVKELYNDCSFSHNCYSKILQLTDLMLGSIRKSYSSIGKSKTAQRELVNIFHDAIKKFSNSKTAYNANSRLYKKFCVNFFPKKNNLTSEEFFDRGLTYILKSSDSFYCDRKTHDEKVGSSSQLTLL